MVLNIKGDWQFLQKSGHLVRHWSCHQVCHLCMATRAGDLSFTNMLPTAPWRQTVQDAPLPWPVEYPPAWARIPGFTAVSLSLDILHAWHLGLGRAFAGSSIRAMCDAGLFGPRPLAQQLQHAWDDFTSSVAPVKPALESFERLLPGKMPKA